MIVHDDIYDDVVERVLAIVAGMRCGDPFDPATVISPVVTREAQQRILAMIERAQSDGAKLLAGGRAPSHLTQGYFVEPTLFVGVDNSMTICRQEVFGPVGVLLPFDSDDEAVAIANDSDFGLSGGVWSRDPVRAYNIARRMRTGNVMINTTSAGGGLSPWAPFGGYKHSGLGREWGAAGMEEYLESKSITWPAGNA